MPTCGKRQSPVDTLVLLPGRRQRTRCSCLRVPRSTYGGRNLDCTVPYVAPARMCRMCRRSSLQCGTVWIASLPADLDVAGVTTAIAPDRAFLRRRVVKHLGLPVRLRVQGPLASPCQCCWRMLAIVGILHQHHVAHEAFVAASGFAGSVLTYLATTNTSTHGRSACADCRATSPRPYCDYPHPCPQPL